MTLLNPNLQLLKFTNLQHKQFQSLYILLRKYKNWLLRTIEKGHFKLWWLQDHLLWRILYLIMVSQIFWAPLEKNSHMQLFYWDHSWIWIIKIFRLEIFTSKMQTRKECIFLTNSFSKISLTLFRESSVALKVKSF
jgi:hypothetical protein